MEERTDKLAPRIIIHENEIMDQVKQERKKPITLLFGFSPVGRTTEMVVCNKISEVLEEFGNPESAPEKYFIDSALRLIQNNSTAIMTRLPYDNDQSHTVKYIDYKVETPISTTDIITIPQESKMRKKDDKGVTILQEMHNLDSRMTQFQRITQIQDDEGVLIHKMTNEELVDLEIDPQDNLEQNTFRIVDIRGDRYGVGAANLEYSGIFPVIVTAPLALYYSTVIKNTEHFDDVMSLMNLQEGIEMSTSWYRQTDPIDSEFKNKQAQIVDSIKQQINFDTKTNRFHRSDSFEDLCVKNFPRVILREVGKLDKTHLNEIGVLVCGIRWDDDEQTTKLDVLESFVGKLGASRNSVDRAINSSSKYIRMYKNVSIPTQTDFFVVNDQKIASLGMDMYECQKFINYKTSILDPIAYTLDSIYSDVDSIELDVILDAGLSSTAFAAYVAKNAEGESYKENDKVRTRIDWSKGEYPIDDYVEDYAYVWNAITKLFGEFIKNVRGDCVYIADGPRILNLERNYPIQNYTNMDNSETFNKYLPLFNGYTNNYVARYWNWVFMEDMQYQNRGFWVPGSVVMGSQLSVNDHDGQVWYAPAGQSRGLINGTYDVSVRTKQYNQENDLLYQNQWNFFNIYQNDGVVVEGQKTLQVKKTSLDRLNVRRMVCWIKQQVRIISNRYKYEPHTSTLRDSYRGDLTRLLLGVQNTNGISEFKIICDDTNNTIQTIDNHELWCKIGIKPIKALEYIIIDLNIINGNVSLYEENAVLLNK